MRPTRSTVSKRSGSDCTVVGNGADVYRTTGSVHYLGAEDTDAVREKYSLSSTIIDMAVGKFAYVPNDVQRIQAMTQYIRSKLEADQVPTIPAHAIDRRHVLLCGSHLDYNYDAANRWAVARWVLVLHDRWMKARGRWASGRLLGGWLARRSCMAQVPWAFKTVYANTYVVSTRLNKAQLVEAFKKPKMPFRDIGTGANAAPDHGERGRALAVSREHGDEH